MADTKVVVVEPATHAELKGVATARGMKLGALADRILSSWLRGEHFFLSVSERSGKAISAKGEHGGEGTE